MSCWRCANNRGAARPQKHVSDRQGYHRDQDKPGFIAAGQPDDDADIFCPKYVPHTITNLITIFITNYIKPDNFTHIVSWHTYSNNIAN